METPGYPKTPPKGSGFSCRYVLEVANESNGVAVDPGSEKGSFLLFVSDDAQKASSLAHALAELGCSASCQVLTPPEALRAIPTMTPDLIVLAMSPSSKEGSRFLSELRGSEFSPSPAAVLVLCDGTDWTIVESAINQGASGWLDENVSAQALLHHIQGMLTVRSRVLARWATLEHAVEARTQAIDEAHLDTLARLCKVAELRDYTTGEHTARVGRLSGLIAQQMHLAPEEVRLIVHTAPVHDIGKVVMPDHIVLKSEDLDQAERELMRRHTTLGADILSRGPSELFRTAEAIAAHHHERWDGGGYPSGLIGQQIPLPARIVAAADSFDAMTHQRPYRQPTSTEIALAEMERERGWQFDPDVVDALLRAIGRHEDPEQHGLNNEVGRTTNVFASLRPPLATRIG